MLVIWLVVRLCWGWNMILICLGVFWMSVVSLLLENCGKIVVVVGVLFCFCVVVFFSNGSMCVGCSGLCMLCVCVKLIVLVRLMCDLIIGVFIVLIYVYIGVCCGKMWLLCRCICFISLGLFMLGMLMLYSMRLMW